MLFGDEFSDSSLVFLSGIFTHSLGGGGKMSFFIYVCL